jgi:beta-1,4-mannosyltransferase
MNSNCEQSLETKTVCFLPFFDANPYQSELARHLHDRGINVVNRKRGMQGLVRDILSRRERAALLHFHWLPSFQSGMRGWLRALLQILRIRMLRIMGVPMVWTVHNLYHHEAQSKRLDRWVYRNMASCMRGMITHSKTARKEVIREFGLDDCAKVEVIPHGNYAESYPNHGDRGRARQELGLAGDPLVFLFFGEVRRYKGVLELVRSFPISNPVDVVLLIVGRPRDARIREDLEREAGKNPGVRLEMGFVPDDKVQTYLNACDVVVLPYQEMLTSGAAVLAMSFGRACIVPRLGSMEEIPGEEGAILYDPEDPNGLGEAIRFAIDRPDSLPIMGERNLMRSRDWDWSGIADRTAGIYEKAFRV